MAGRAGEKIFKKDFGPGAAHDMEVARKYAERMVTEWGMSDALGSVKYRNIFAGLTGVWNRRFYTQETLQILENEVGNLVRSAEKSADELVAKYREALEKIATGLLERKKLQPQEMFEMVKATNPELDTDLSLIPR